MKNVSAQKSNKNESPKTPGGISKSLLTPCRRLGLSRKWKKAGPSPFVSPLCSSHSCSVEVKIEKKESRKRKERILDEDSEEISEEAPQTPVENDGVSDVDESDLPVKPVRENGEIVSTPSRTASIPRKKSKTLLSAISSSKANGIEHEITPLEAKQPSDLKINEDVTNLEIKSKDQIDVRVIEAVATPVRKKSKTKTTKKYTSPAKTIPKVIETDVKKDSSSTESKENIDETKNQDSSKEIEIKAISPNELTKKCIVVLQKKIYKTDKEPMMIKEKPDGKSSDKMEGKSGKNSVSQTLFDSDNDELPLAQLNKKESAEKLKKIPEIITIDEDDDFTNTKTVKVKKLEHKNTSTTTLKSKNKPTKTQKPKEQDSKPKTTNSFDDEEDFDFEKRTILIKKTYDKVTKPLKAKSTGSITQRDIDELKARIEMKKKMLLAKAMTEDTAELRGLIKKWQKGCQEALMELMELMKTKFPEKQNMDYSEILKILQIPTNLVGYDEENDCFNTPDDANIVLSKFND